MDNLAVAICAALFLAVFFALYRLAHLLVQWEPFHFPLLRTSPTHYWRRYLSRGIRAADFMGGGGAPDGETRGHT